MVVCQPVGYELVIQDVAGFCTLNDSVKYAEHGNNAIYAANEKHPHLV
jgi:hypothetical protein